MASANDSVVTEAVKEYYGKVLKKTDDLKTNACRTACQKMPCYISDVLDIIHDDVIERYYGCGLVIPECLENCAVLDLGCGSGRDCYIISKLVGQQGKVMGIDMTKEQLDVARSHIADHMEKYGFSKPNIEFSHGYIEDLKEAGVQDGHYDVIVSNCVINLSPNKRAVLKGAYKALKTGGEFYFSDVYADKELGEDVRKHQVLWGECIGGALYWRDLVKIAVECGFSCPRLVNASEIVLENNELKEVIGNARFVSATYRLFKLPQEKSPECGVIYDGKIKGSERAFLFDHICSFRVNEVTEVDAEVSTILKSSRFKSHFTFQPSSGMLHDPDPFKYATLMGNVGPGCAVQPDPMAPCWTSQGVKRSSPDDSPVREVRSSCRNCNKTCFANTPGCC